MKAPDKIYVGIQDIGSGYAYDLSLDDNGQPEYIRKDTLLTWLEEELAQRQQWLDRYGEGEDLHAKQELEKVIDRINSM